MGEFMLLVTLLQAASAPEGQPAPVFVRAAYSAGPFNENGCKNAMRAEGLKAQAGGYVALTVCVPRNVAKLEQPKPEAQRSN